MHQADELEQKFAQEVAALKPLTPSQIQQQKGKRAQAYKHPNPVKARRQGRMVPKMVHSTELDDSGKVEVEDRFLRDIAVLTKKVRQFKRDYVPGECNPYALPEGGRTVVTVTAKQRMYEVDGVATLYVDLRHRYTAEEKAAIKEANDERRKTKIPGGKKGQRPFQVVREIIMEREI
jgi:hypothetical protein